jgi:hypothetical protein
MKELVGMVGLDLIAAFHMVNIKLLIKQLKILGLPVVVNLIKLWLEDRSFFVSIDGTVQGSILGPILYVIYISLLFDLHNLTSFANNNFIIGWSSHMPELIADLERSLVKKQMVKGFWAYSQ